MQGNGFGHVGDLPALLQHEQEPVRAVGEVRTHAQRIVAAHGGNLQVWRNGKLKSRVRVLRSVKLELLVCLEFLFITDKKL